MKTGSDLPPFSHGPDAKQNWRPATDLPRIDYTNVKPTE